MALLQNTASPDEIDSADFDARVDKLVPYNAEQAAKDHGALYEKGRIPFKSYAVVDSGSAAQSLR